jgi:nucleotide-binding universal stress UspA family protein
MNDKKIIVGIDFSQCSINALKYTIDIANKSHSDILMVWVNKPDNRKAIFLIDSDKIKEAVEKQFKKLISKYQSKLENGKISYVIKEGKIYKEIIDTANKNNAFAIVVGTHGLSGFEEFCIGSNANRIVSSAKCPVFTVRLRINIDKELKKIVLPIDNTFNTRQKVPFTASIAKHFDAKIHILALYSIDEENIKKIVDNYVKQIVSYLDENKVKYSLDSSHADNITDSTIKFAKKINANLISIMDEQEKSLNNFLLGSYARQMVNNSPIPVLYIHVK